MPIETRNQVGRDAGMRLLLDRHLAMRGRGRVAGERAGVADIDEALHEAQRVVERLAALEATDDAESEQRRGLAAEVATRERVIGAVREPSVIDPGDALVATQEFGDGAGVGDMALHAQRHRFDALKDQERVERRQHRAGRTLIDAAGAGDVGRGAIALVVHHAVVRGVRFAEHREFLRLIAPAEAAGIDHHAGERGAVAAHELGQGFDDDVGAMLDRPQQDGRRHRIVDDERHAVAVRTVRKRGDVRDVASRVADAFAVDGLGVGIDQRLDRGDIVAGREARRDPLPRQDMREQRVRRTV